MKQFGFFSLEKKNDMKCVKQISDYDDGCCFTYVGPQQPMEYDKNGSYDRADFFGEQLYAKLSRTPEFEKYSKDLNKIVGIFLELDDDVIDKLIKDGRYFNLQVREVIQLLTEKEKSK